MKKFSLFLALAAVFATFVASAAFAQRVGDSVQVAGQPYTIETISGDRITLIKAAQTGDGPVNWTAVSNSPFGTSTVYGVAWGNNTWVAVGGGAARGEVGKIAYSTDNGRSWTLSTQTVFGDRQPIYDVTYANNMFVAVGAGMAATSTDGRTWTAVTFPIEGYIIAFANGRFIAGGYQGKTAYSTDGRAWTAVDATGVFSGSGVGVRGVAFGSNRFVAVGQRGQIAYSSNGQSWTASGDSTFTSRGRPDVRAGTAQVENTIIWGTAYGANRFVIVGARGQMAYSADGAAWTSIIDTNNPFENYHLFDITFGNNRFVAVGDLGRIGYSTNGIAWTLAANSAFGASNNRIEAVSYGSGRFVAVGEQGKIAYADW